MIWLDASTGLPASLGAGKVGTVGGQATDMLIATNFAKRTKERINRILAENIGKDIETITRDTERDNWMYAEDALAYGIIDGILEAKK